MWLQHLHTKTFPRQKVKRADMENIRSRSFSGKTNSLETSQQNAEQLLEQHPAQSETQSERLNKSPEAKQIASSLGNGRRWQSPTQKKSQLQKSASAGLWDDSPSPVAALRDRDVGEGVRMTEPPKKRRWTHDTGAAIDVEETTIDHFDGGVGDGTPIEQMVRAGTLSANGVDEHVEATQDGGVLHHVEPEESPKHFLFEEEEEEEQSEPVCNEPRVDDHTDATAGGTWEPAKKSRQVQVTSSPDPTLPSSVFSLVQHLSDVPMLSQHYKLHSFTSTGRKP